MAGEEKEGKERGKGEESTSKFILYWLARVGGRGEERSGFSRLPREGGKTRSLSSGPPPKGGREGGKKRFATGVKKRRGKNPGVSVRCAAEERKGKLRTSISISEAEGKRRKRKRILYHFVPGRRRPLSRSTKGGKKKGLTSSPISMRRERGGVHNDLLYSGRRKKGLYL